MVATMGMHRMCWCTVAGVASLHERKAVGDEGASHAEDDE
jgi:hypothetical protein